MDRIRQFMLMYAVLGKDGGLGKGSSEEFKKFNGQEGSLERTTKLLVGDFTIPFTLLGS